MRAPCLDAVCKLLQSFGSDRLHGGDESRQLVLGARCCSLKTTWNKRLCSCSMFSTDHAVQTLRWCRPAAWSQTLTCSSSGVWGWGRWWARLSNRDAWWPGGLRTRCCPPPASGCPAPPVDTPGNREQSKHSEAGIFCSMWEGNIQNSTQRPNQVLVVKDESG